MKQPKSLELKLAIRIGSLVTILWLGAAVVTSIFLQKEVNEQFDDTMAETAQRILPIASMEILGRDDFLTSQRLDDANRHDEESITYVIRNSEGHVLFQSHDADLKIFPPVGSYGFSRNSKFRFYNDSIPSRDLTITLAEPFDHRREILFGMQLSFGLPLLLIVPLCLFGIGYTVRTGLGPLRRLRDELAIRSAGDMAPIEKTEDMPSEMAPAVDALNDLLSRLKTTFEAERSFASNAAHELRTPLAGAIAQIQRMQSEINDPTVKQRSAEIERTLKRLTHLSERLMQLARAEGGKMRADTAQDMRAVLRMVVDDVKRAHPDASISLDMSANPVESIIDMDAFGILSRNLVENAVKYGASDQDISVNLSKDGRLTVTNDCPAIPEDTLNGLTDRFARNAGDTEGAGLGLAIVNSIAKHTRGDFHLSSPVQGQKTGFQATFILP